VDFVEKWSDKAELSIGWFIEKLGIVPGKFYD